MKSSPLFACMRAYYTTHRSHSQLQLCKPKKSDRSAYTQKMRRISSPEHRTLSNEDDHMDKFAAGRTPHRHCTSGFRPGPVCKMEEFQDKRNNTHTTNSKQPHLTLSGGLMNNSMKSLRPGDLTTDRTTQTGRCGGAITLFLVESMRR